MEQNLHRRKSSREEDDGIVLVTPPTEIATNGFPPPVTVGAPPPPRGRVQSTPAHYRSHSGIPPSPSFPVQSPTLPPSAGPYRTSFNVNHRPPPLLPNGMNGHPSSPFRSSFSTQNPNHSRTRSISTPFASPLVPTFPISPSRSSPDASSPTHLHPPLSPKQPLAHTRRHSRLHSRNLSVFFPRPGSLPLTNTISEDGDAQEIEVHVNDDEESHIPIPSASPNVSLPGRTRRTPHTPLGANFTFGARPPSTLPMPPMMDADPVTTSSTSTSTTRRGHHHKHSMSHNFFSFLEPGGLRGGDDRDPASVPASPWQPVSPFPASTPAPQQQQQQQRLIQVQNGAARQEIIHSDHQRSATERKASAIIQFVLGSWLWVSGQQNGSLSCTGLGYWVVFDAFGIWSGAGVNFGRDGEKGQGRRFFGSARVETVLMFAQVVYLMFSSVYICKETVEHLLLSAGHDGDGHHHHHGRPLDADIGEVSGIDFPIILVCFALATLLISALKFRNHEKLVTVTETQAPTLRSLLRPRKQHQHSDSLPTTLLGKVMRNPFVVIPIGICFGILGIWIGISGSQHRISDLILAALITIATSNVAYRACIVLGTVLLQTAPRRGLVGGKMEAFLRVMRELERHPHILHLPAPHIWQLTPSSSSSFLYGNGTSGHGASEDLVVTLELHVKDDLGDDDVLKLTRWAWERCVGALEGAASKAGSGAGARTAEVTVGVVRG